ncbi:MAG: tRNA uridine(34) 5-carboxymethylaminomethyl modification radical SAM/GNAT enzyme Elp3, partial [Candidatus Thermoplasmatota archaeon]|nr:tRNA uridine(34) 5-carboxymethylaminomethyl modification radical SAM/GNAT enzyme Elp3 [Candidatus Thermoplasmatota archaeon]
MDYFGDIIEEIRAERITDAEEFERRKVQLCRKHGMEAIPPNSEILRRVPPDLFEKVLPIVRLKPSRTLSGIASVAIMTSPYNCPHGTCIYCPGGAWKNSAQAYTGKEPAARRAGMNDFDPYRQTKSRLEQLNAIGHSTNKIDLIIMGGTFTARTEEYQRWFVKRAFDAMNGFDAKDISEAHAFNERAENRCIGLTVETRPDQLSQHQIDFSLGLGATRVEIGVQCLFDEVLRRANRAHDVQSVIDSTARAKDSGMKVGYHMMPGLPGMTDEMELENFTRLFSSPSFRPDMLKIYPTLIIEGTPLYEMHRKGLYDEYTLEKAVKLLARVKKDIPEYVRIQRIQRDIPAPMISAGVKKSNLRELVRVEMERQGWKCGCMRCREVGHLGIAEQGIKSSEVDLRSMEYEASGGVEHFISFEYNDAIVGYLRLRLPPSGPAYIRELKVFGRVVPVGEDSHQDWQHKGYGSRLVAQAEEISRNAGYGRIRVTSGVGVRDYYRRLGYDRDSFYLGKNI